MDTKTIKLVAGIAVGGTVVAVVGYFGVRAIGRSLGAAASKAGGAAAAAAIAATRTAASVATGSAPAGGEPPKVQTGNGTANGSPTVTT